jgi:hypothetical protein
MKSALDLTCPHCGKLNDMHDNLTDPAATPAHDDVSLCIGCGRLSLFDLEANRLRVPTPRELASLISDDEVRRAMRAWLAMDEARRRRQINPQ